MLSFLTYRHPPPPSPVDTGYLCIQIPGYTNSKTKKYAFLEKSRDLIPSLENINWSADDYKNRSVEIAILSCDTGQQKRDRCQ